MAPTWPNLTPWAERHTAKAPPRPVAVAAVNWTGLYIGGHAGGGWGTNDWNNATGVVAISGSTFPGSPEVNGLIGGGQIGYNYQTGGWVFGAQADAHAADLFVRHIDD